MVESFLVLLQVQLSCRNCCHHRCHHCCHPTITEMGVSSHIYTQLGATIVCASAEHAEMIVIYLWFLFFYISKWVSKSEGGSCAHHNIKLVWPKGGLINHIPECKIQFLVLVVRVRKSFKCGIRLFVWCDVVSWEIEDSICGECGFPLDLGALLYTLHCMHETPIHYTMSCVIHYNTMPVN